MKKRHIKLAAFLLTICCLLISFPGTPVIGSVTPTLQIVSVSGQPGDEVTVDIGLQGNPGIAYLKLKVDYNPELSVVKAENRGVLAGTFTTSKTAAVKPYVLQWMGASDSEENGIIATVTFKISESATVGNKPVTVTVEECYNSSFNDVVFGITNGNITVNDPAAGTDPDPGNQPNPPEDPHEPLLVVSAATVHCDEEITLDIVLRDNPGFAYLKLEMDYDSSVLSLVGVNNLGVIDGTFTASRQVTVKPYVLQWMGADDATGDGKIATITFKALAVGQTAVSLSVKECYNSHFEDIMLATEGGSVRVTAAECGHNHKTYIPEKESTCLEQGNDPYYICDDCKQILAADGVTKMEAIPFRPLGSHAGGTATCTDLAVCTVCGKSYGSLALNNHSGEAEVRGQVAATCEETGYSGDLYCKNCGGLISPGSTVSSVGHAWGEWVQTKAPTAAEPGVEIRICQNDPTHTEARDIPLFSILTGDVDGDGKVTSTDARLVLQLAVNKITESDLAVPSAADMDGDSNITSTDARLILQFAVGKIIAWS